MAPLSVRLILSCRPNELRSLARIAQSDVGVRVRDRPRARDLRRRDASFPHGGGGGEGGGHRVAVKRFPPAKRFIACVASYFLFVLCMAIGGIGVRAYDSALIKLSSSLAPSSKNYAGVKCHSSHAWQAASVSAIRGDKTRVVSFDHLRFW